MRTHDEREPAAMPSEEERRAWAETLPSSEEPFWITKTVELLRAYEGRIVAATREEERRAWAETLPSNEEPFWITKTVELLRAYEGRIVAATREACAREAEEVLAFHSYAGDVAAAAIRAMGAKGAR